MAWGKAGSKTLTSGGELTDITLSANKCNSFMNHNVTISAKNDVHFEELLRLIDLNLAEGLQKESIILKFCEGRKRSWLMENNLVQGERYLSHGIKLDVRWSARQKGKFLNLDRGN